MRGLVDQTFVYFFNVIYYSHLEDVDDFGDFVLDFITEVFLN